MATRPASPPMGPLHASRVVGQTINRFEQLRALGPEWDQLVRSMPRPSPFLLHGWLTEWWTHYGRGTLAIATGRRNGSLVAALPLFVRSYGGVRVMSFIGGRQSALADLMVAGNADRRLVDTVLEEVAAEEHDVADLFGLPADSRLVAALDPSDLRLIPRVEAPVLDMSAGWETVYREKTSSKRRNGNKRRRRQLEELGRLEVSVATTPGLLEPALNEAFRVHKLRFAGRRDRSGLGTATGMRFHMTSTLTLAEMDIPRIVTLTLDGRAIAFFYYFALCGSMYCYRMAFDEAYGRFSPGTLVTMEALRAASAEGLTRVELLGGVEAYKLEFADRLEPLHEGVGLVSTIRGRTFASARLFGLRLYMRLKGSDRFRRLYSNQLQRAHRARSRINAAMQGR